ncbi:MAG TPA: hypothetical protein VL854_06290, partial [Nitrososphaeraceae archaeon]|nr:hypothetical protein [Nitrososphaeraceae archaeon]
IGNDPDNPTDDTSIQEYLRADIATYLAVGDNISCSNAKLFSLFNNSGFRLCIQKISVIPRVPATNTIFLSIGYINSTPTGGTDGLVNKYSVAYPPTGASPPTLISLVPCKKLPTSPNGVANVNLGNEIVNLTGTLKLTRQTIFTVEGNGSALILRPGQDGITIEQVAQTATGGAVTLEVLFTLG